MAAKKRIKRSLLQKEAGEARRSRHPEEAENRSVALKPAKQGYYHSLIDYLYPRHVLITLLALEALVVVYLWPGFRVFSIEKSLSAQVEAQNHEGAYRRLRSLSSGFGIQPGDTPGSLGALWRRYWKKSPNYWLRHHLDSPMYLVEMDQHEAALALVEAIPVEASTPNKFYAGNRWKVSYVKGRVALARGEKESAVAFFKAALAISPNNEMVSFHYGRLLYDEGRLLEAASWLTNAIAHAVHGEAAKELLQKIEAQLLIEKE